jgi:hypothetical protein
MNPSMNAYRLVPVPAIAALALTLAACGGGSSADSATATPSASSDPYAGTAHLKTQETYLHTNGSTGIARDVFQVNVDQCNAFRDAQYKLPAVQPPEVLMAGLDVKVVERYYDNGRSVETTAGYGLTLPDMQRWLDDLKAAQGNAAAVTPPDCAAAKRQDSVSGWLWLDGVKYELRYDTRQAIGTRGGSSFTRSNIATSAEVAAWSKKQVMGETCLVASGPNVPPSLTSGCLWDRFPAAQYLNLPWMLDAPQPGLSERKLIVTLGVDSGKATPAGKLDLPAGFTVKVIN